MQKLTDVRGRMKSVAGIGEVCKTLSTVAAAKLAKTRERAMAAREYALVLRDMATRQQSAAASAGIDPAGLSPLMETRPVSHATVLVIGADRGLCGGYNSAVGRSAREVLERFQRQGVGTDQVVIGLRAARYLRKTLGLEIEDATTWGRSGVTEELVERLLKRVTEAFLTGESDEVWAVCTGFVSAVQREQRVVRLLPIAAAQPVHAFSESESWFFEPDRGQCIVELLEALVRLQIEDVLLESFASEQAARMVTMQEASERADKVLQDLWIHYNRVRRESITEGLTGALVAGRMRKVARDV